MPKNDVLISNSQIYYIRWWVLYSYMNVSFRYNSKKIIIIKLNKYTYFYYIIIIEIIYTIIHYICILFSSCKV